MGDAAPHSAACFNEERAFWWNPDFLDLLARRFELGRVTSLLDVGCGLMHWSRLLLPRLAPGARLVGLERETAWVVEADGHARSENLGARLVQGDGSRLPFADGSFDAATCQTVLMHVPDAEAVLREMARVVRPGGLVVAAEPDNMLNAIDFSEATQHRPIAEVTLLFELWLTCVRGKQALGLGDEMVGERLPGLFHRVGLTGVTLHLNDRTSPLQPPYEDPQARAMLSGLRTWKARNQGPWDRVELARRFEAGGGDPGRFDRAFALLERWWLEDQDAVEAGTFRSAGGGLFFVASGRRAA